MNILLVLLKYLSSSGLVTLTLVTGISLSMGISWLVWQQERNFLTTRFEKSSHDVAISLQQEINHHWKIFDQIHYFYQASEVVEPQKFQIFGQGTMSEYPWVHVLAWFPAESNWSVPPGETVLDPNSDDQNQNWESLPVAYMVSKYSSEIGENFNFARYPQAISDLQKARDTGEIILIKSFSLSMKPEEKYKDFDVWAIRPMYRSSFQLTSVEARRQSLDGFILNIFNLGELISQTLAVSANRDPWVKNSHMVWFRDRPTTQPANSSTTTEAPQQNHKEFFLFYNAQTGDVTDDLGDAESVDVPSFLCGSRSVCTHQIQMGNEQWSVEFLPTREWLKTIQYWKIWMTLLLALSTTAFLSLYLPASFGRKQQTKKQAWVIESQHLALIAFKEYKMNTETLLANTSKEAERIQAQLKQELQIMTKLNEELKQANAELKQMNAEMMLLGNMTHLLQACVTEEEAYATISEFIEKLFPHQSGVIYLINESKNMMQAMKSWGADFSNTEFFSPCECWALRSGREYLFDRTQNNLPCKHYHANSEQSLCIPLVAQGDTLGMLYFESSSQQTKLNSAKFKLGMNLGKHIGLALANLKLRHTLEHQSIRDPLTGLYNRRYLEEFLDQQIQRVQRNHQPFALLMIDVDHFKQFNDTFGHDAGDRILQELGKMLHEQLRGSDVACRYGGEELTLILPDISWENAKKRAEEIRQEIKQLNVKSGKQLLGHITASFGVALFPDDGLTAVALFESADAALYRAKAQGRDRVVMASKHFIESLPMKKLVT